MPNNTKKEECHCQRTDRLHRVDSNFKNHTFERCWKDKNKEEVCPCDDGAKVVKQHLEGCKYFYPSPQSPLSEKECNCTISPRNVHYKDCPLVAPSSNEDWMIKFYEQFGANKIWVTPSRDNVQTIFEIENFIRQQRLGAQRELTEEIINYMEDGLDEPTDWYVSVKNFLSSRGLLPKITE